MTSVVVLLACLVAEPARCEEVELLVERCPSPIILFHISVIWDAEHEAHAVRRVTCETGMRT